MPSDKSLWLPTANTTNWRLVEAINIVLYHVLPALLFDAAFWAAGSSFRLIPMYRKAHKFMVANTFFMRRQWAFGNARMKAVYERMSAEDRRFFAGDVRESRFEEYVKVYYMGIRRYLLKETLVDQRWALWRMHGLRVLHWVLLAGLYWGLWMLVYAVLVQAGWSEWVERLGAGVWWGVWRPAVEWLAGCERK